MLQLFYLLFSVLFMLPGCFFNDDSKQKPGTIVILTGTTSSGKSAVIDAMKKLYGDTYQYFNFDEFEAIAAQQKRRPLSPQEIAQLIEILAGK